MSEPHVLAQGEFLTRLAVGAFLGLLIGFERQWRGRPAGLHTTGLVAAGAAIFSAIQPALGTGTSDRVIANIVTGIGFLAGGVILREGSNISGLNTAGTIWATAAVGVLAGIGLFREATGAAIVVIAINVLMNPIENAVNARVARRRTLRTHRDT
jgi:putative Mg2+ transporter-C (MgtC) family protein